ncbi:MAG: C39 family peptidase [Bacilli bacterium]|nr:C39 family peptidase [Bacilli bacterium]
MKKKKKIIIIVISSIVGALALAVAIPFIVLGVRTSNLKADYEYLRSDASYNDKVEITGIELVTQHVSCGYATIEMMSSYYGNKVTEDELDARNKSVSTSSSNGFLKEISKCIPNKSFVMRPYLKHDALLKEIHDSIKSNNPVAIEWAAKYEGEWTLHFSVISGLDLSNDNITIYNPYGYIENITINDFISRSSFEAYSSIPLFLNFGFAYGAFHKNTIFYAK